MTRTRKSLRQRNILILMEWYDHRIRQGIGQYARTHNWHLTVNERALIPSGWEGDGILTVFHRRRDFVRYLRGVKVPIVDMGLYRPDIPLPRVVGDHRRIGALAAEHFAERGFKHTAWFSAERSPIQALRLEGFASGCSTQGLAAPYRWLWEEVADGSPDDWQLVRRWLGRLLRRAPKPLAVFAYNDYDASNVEDVCREVGIAVPEEVAILGVDDNELICLNQPVPLSSIAHDLTRVGYDAAELIDRLIDGAPPPVTPLLIPPTGVVLRQSTDLSAVSIPAVRAAMRFIKENLSNSFGIEEVAAAVGVSRSTLDRLFIQHLNRSVHKEVQRARLSSVKHHLLNTDLSVAEIARRTGFCHAQYLNNLFRHVESMTPRVYRKRYGVGSMNGIVP
ncbi:MAG TPA: DNA-binding transcriptional regulator [Kiritimatiellia bacterium]|nr:DNA-binding transcriptional regulator [Kiritimatiellia bacterium]HRU69892.1 DNA-binding transcriptional regulator [Kiritimatiellia bacterium]